MFEAFILPGISLGLSASALPGPLQAYLINTTLTQGWRRGLLVVASPLITDSPIILLMTFILGQMPDTLLQLIRLAGGAFLLFIAWGAWKQYRAGISFNTEPAATDASPKPTDRPLKVLGTAVMMNFLSPGPYLFWGVITGPLLLQALEQSGWHALAFLLSFYGTFLGILTVMVFAFDRLGRLDDRITQWVILLAIVLLLWFGTSLIAEGLGLVELHRVLSVVVLVVGLAWMVWQTIRKRQFLD